MKDITPKVRTKTQETESKSTHPSSSFRKKTVKTLEKGLELGTTYSNLLYQKFSSPRAIISESLIKKDSEEGDDRVQQERRIENVPVKKEHRKGERRKKVATAFKNGAKRTHHSIKSPVGKLAVVQAVALLALFGYVSSTTRGGTTKADNLAITNTNTVGTIQKRLPSVAQYTAPKEFNENLLVKQDSSVPLHTWLTPWNISDLEAHKDDYASVSAFWLTVNSDGIHLDPKSDWSIWQSYKKLPKKNAQQAFVTVSGDPNYTYLALISPQTQEDHINQLLKVVEDQGFDGVDIDYEGLGNDNRELFTSFIRNLTTVFHAHNKLVAVTVEARLNNQVPMDWQALGQIADEMRLMVYDYHSQNTGTPGPITPIGWLKEVLDYSQSTITKSKIVVGLGNYGYDWTKITNEDGTTSWKGVGLSFDQAIALATEEKAPIVRATGIDERGYDIGSIPSFNYKDEKGAEHSVWFEDNQSLQNKINLVNQYKTDGVIFWSVGLGDKAFWRSTLSR